MPEWDATKCDVGVIGLDAAGRKVALNLAGQAFRVAACCGQEETCPAPPAEGDMGEVALAASFPGLAGRLKKPRTIFLFSGAKIPADTALNGLLAHLEKGDIVIDAGNSHYKETARRSRLLAGRSMHLIGLGLAGREGGAVIMAGGTPEAYERARPMLEAIAAKIHGEPCVSYLGPAAAGHFVKMVHAGIGHGLMQLLCETLDLAQRMLPLNEEELRKVSEARPVRAPKNDWIEAAGEGFDPLAELTGRWRTGERPGRVNNNELAGWMAQSAARTGGGDADDRDGPGTAGGGGAGTALRAGLDAVAPADGAGGGGPGERAGGIAWSALHGGDHHLRGGPGAAGRGRGAAGI